MADPDRTSCTTEFTVALREHRVIAIVRDRTGDSASAVVRNLLRCGAKLVEVTTTTPGWAEILSQHRDTARQVGARLGAGTVLTVEQARHAVSAGAQFLVAPNTDPALLNWAATHDIAAVPGAYTATEVLLAHRAGAAAVKLFPAPDPAYTRALLTAIDAVPLVPTGGIAPAQAAAQLAAGAAGVGVGGWLTDRTHGLAERMAQLRTAVLTASWPAP